MRFNVYSIEWDPDALKKFHHIQDHKLKEHIMHAIERSIAQDPLIGKLLAGSFKGMRSYRIGVIRILYKIYKDRLVVMVLDIDHRKNIYR